MRNGEAARAKDYLHKAVEMVAHDGVSSSYSYNPINAHANQARHTLATQSAILIDLVGRYVAGITPRTDDLFEFNPVALDPSRGSLKFGPFRYKQKHWITAGMDRRGVCGYGGWSVDAVAAAAARDRRGGRREAEDCWR